MAASTSFTRFPKLPKELQHEIWSRACNIPRITEVKYLMRMETNGSKRFLAPCGDLDDHYIAITTMPPPIGGLSWQYFTLKSCLIPALLHSCSESRQRALRSYRKILADPPVYFNSAVDTIYTPTSSSPLWPVNHFREALVSGSDIQRLAMNCPELNPWGQSYGMLEVTFLQNLKRVTGLKELTFIATLPKRSCETEPTTGFHELDDANSALLARWKNNISTDLEKSKENGTWEDFQSTTEERLLHEQFWISWKLPGLIVRFMDWERGRKAVDKPSRRNIGQQQK
jgi:hypothetical protein